MCSEVSVPERLLICSSSLPATYEGGVELNHTRVLATGGYPFYITEPGQYRLTSDLTPFNRDAIVVLAADVSIEMNGFTIIGNGVGTGITCAKPNCFICNGTVTKMMYGILLLDNSGVEHVRVVSNGFLGIGLTDGGLVAGCTIAKNGSQGINSTGRGTRIVGNIISENGRFGVMMRGGLLRGNAIFNHQELGFHTNVPAAVTHRENILFGNGSAKDTLQSHSNMSDDAVDQFWSLLMNAANFCSWLHLRIPFKLRDVNDPLNAAGFRQVARTVEQRRGETDECSTTSDRSVPDRRGQCLPTSRSKGCSDSC